MTKTTHHTSINCPLHNSGGDAGATHPIADFDAYVSFLERPERAIWQKPNEVVSALGAPCQKGLLNPSRSRAPG